MKADDTCQASSFRDYNFNSKDYTGYLDDPGYTHYLSEYTNYTSDYTDYTFVIIRIIFQAKKSHIIRTKKIQKKIRQIKNIFRIITKIISII